MTSQDIPPKIGGWLMLMGVAVVLAPCRLLYGAWATYTEVTQPYLWDILTNPANPGHQSGLFILVLVEIAGNFLLALAGFYLISLFFGKKKQFPRLYTRFLAIFFLFILADSLIAAHITGNSGLLFDKELIRGASFTLIWGSYLRFSKRVAATFIC